MKEIKIKSKSGMYHNVRLTLTVLTAIRCHYGKSKNRVDLPSEWIRDQMQTRRNI